MRGCWERKRDTWDERETSVSWCVCPDWQSNLSPLGVWDDAPTNAAIEPGWNETVIFAFTCDSLNGGGKKVQRGSRLPPPWCAFLGSSQVSMRNSSASHRLNLWIALEKQHMASFLKTRVTAWKMSGICSQWVVRKSQCPGIERNSPFSSPFKISEAKTVLTSSSLD